MNKKFNKNAKVEKLTKKVGRGVRLIEIGPYTGNIVHFLLLFSRICILFMEHAFLNFVLSCGLVFHYGMHATHAYVHAVHFNSRSLFRDLFVFGLYCLLLDFVQFQS